jgi:hypothetical protein
MGDWLPELRSGYDRATIRTIRVAFALSLLLHIAVLWPWLPQPHFLSLENSERGNAGGPLIVQLAPVPNRAITPPPAPPPSPPVPARPVPTKRAPAPKVAPSPRPAPPVVALNKPAPAIVSPPAPPPVIAPPAPPVAGDLSSYIEARRRARREAPRLLQGDDPPPPPQPEEDERARHNRIVAENLGLLRTPTFGYDPKGGGGIFQMQRMGVDEAEFIFFGWNKDIRRNSRQLIAVQRGDNGDIRIAVVRKMIAIIRESESGDFVWRSQRLGQNITLSARPADNAGLEDFLMRDLFSGTGSP